jgi:hypothetical protein
MASLLDSHLTGTGNDEISQGGEPQSQYSSKWSLRQIPSRYSVSERLVAPANGPQDDDQPHGWFPNEFEWHPEGDAGKISFDSEDPQAPTAEFYLHHTYLTGDTDVADDQAILSAHVVRVRIRGLCASHDSKAYNDEAVRMFDTFHDETYLREVVLKCDWNTVHSIIVGTCKKIREYQASQRTIESHPDKGCGSDTCV